MIYPVSPGRDGWSVLYDTDVKRLLFLCGLRWNGQTWRLRSPG